MSLMQMLLAGVTQRLIGTFNPSDKGGTITVSNGNLTLTNSSGTAAGARSTNSESTGVWYVEQQVTLGNGCPVGLANGSASVSSYAGATNSIGFQTFDGNVYSNGGGAVASGLGSGGGTIGMLIDFGAGTVKWNRNGGSFSSGFTLPSGALYLFTTPSNGGAQTTLNVTPTYSLPSGAKYWGN